MTVTQNVTKMHYKNDIVLTGQDEQEIARILVNLVRHVYSKGRR